MTKFKQLGFYIDQANCTGCKACQTACNDKHDLPDATCRATVFGYYTSISCNHCEDPICVEVCPSQAMKKGENGIVSIDPEVCIGCRYSEMAWPPSAPPVK